MKYASDHLIFAEDPISFNLFYMLKYFQIFNYFIVQDTRTISLAYTVGMGSSGRTGTFIHAKNLPSRFSRARHTTSTSRARIQLRVVFEIPPPCSRVLSLSLSLVPIPAVPCAHTRLFPFPALFRSLAHPLSSSSPLFPPPLAFNSRPRPPPTLVPCHGYLSGT